MRTILSTIVIILIGAGCGGAPSAQVRDLAALEAAPLYSFDERELDRYLSEIYSREWSLPDQVAHFARKSLGQPYRLGLLGEFPYELYDADPTYCLAASDCVTFVEQIFAMALAEDWPSFYRNLQRIRYCKGAIGLMTRNHFTEADWNVNNRWLLRDVTDRLVPDVARPLMVTVNRAALFATYGVITQDEPEEFETDYIPRDAVQRVCDKLRTGDVVEFVRGRDKALFVGHVGIILVDNDQPPMLIHSATPMVREEPLQEYIESLPTIRGIKVLRPRSTPTPERSIAQFTVPADAR